MITPDGRIHIKRYMAGYIPSIAQSIAFGIGSEVNSDTDRRLQFETNRADVVITAYDFANDKLIFKAPVPDEYAGTIYEVAIFSAASDEVAGEFGSKLLTTFDSATEDWNDVSTGADATYVSANSRIGVDSLRQAPSANGSVTNAITELSLDLGGHSASDKFVFAYNVGTANTSSIRFRFMTDSANYYDITLGAQTAGYKISTVAKGAAVATGVPSWGNISEIRVTTNSNASGASQVDFDAIRIEDVDTLNPDYVMVAREVLATPFTKQEGRVQDIEFALDVNIT